MQTRSASVLGACASVACAAIFAVGCHGSATAPAQNPRVTEPQAYPDEMASPSAPSTADTTNTTTQPQTAQNQAKPTNDKGPTSPSNVSPSTPPSSTGKAPFKPNSGSETPPSAVGGGPKSETGGAVFGDGNEGNTGAIKGGEAPPSGDGK